MVNNEEKKQVDAKHQKYAEKFKDNECTENDWKRNIKKTCERKIPKKWYEKKQPLNCKAFGNIPYFTFKERNVILLLQMLT